MDVGRRAKQFAPFAALRGLDETIRQQEIIYEPKRDLSEEKKNELDMKLRILAYGMKIQATYFQKSWKNPLIGQYHTLSGTVEFFDPSVHLRMTLSTHFYRFWCKTPPTLVNAGDMLPKLMPQALS